MQTALPAVLALTFPGSVGTSTGLSGVMSEQNRWSSLLPLGSMFLAGLSNLVYIGPATTRVMKQRKHQETRDGKKSYDQPPHSAEMQRLNRRFGALHGVSSLVNLLGFLATVWYGGTIADMLQ